MRVRAILTDLDGTLLEPDGRLDVEARVALDTLAAAGVSVVPVTSKTAAEVGWLLAQLGLFGPAGFENGAGVLGRDGLARLSHAAVPIAVLRRVADQLRAATGAPVRTFEELGDTELTAITGLAGPKLGRARCRQATLPLAVDSRWDEALRAAAPPEVALVRGNRFLHLQGRHAKADVVPALLAAVPGAGTVVACGDAPNDVELLSTADVAVIIPSAHGVHAGLGAALPGARVAPAPHGRGWALAVLALLAEAGRPR
ncbi:MAG: HAD-IIB family hydrolase [Thermoanaerobaculaceae bacterium]|nr:HAD-IIB family hydrolase [Thermoanaerobaculaceae bacterium]MDI9620488.1 HAD-IIB family hydrolase [Acidobacteriota bacterium]NLH12718.1 HAD-IIB family hydrolase [Holophagae bacterium]